MNMFGKMSLKQKITALILRRETLQVPRCSSIVRI